MIGRQKGRIDREIDVEAKSVLRSLIRKTNVTSRTDGEVELELHGELVPISAAGTKTWTLASRIQVLVIVGTCCRTH